VSWRKDRIQEWITSHGETFVEYMLKKHLIGTVYSIRPTYDKYRIDEMGHTVVRLPPYHCELKPIEIAWAQIKHHIQMNNTSFKIKYMEQLFQQGFESVTADRWTDCVEHVTRVEAGMWRAEEIHDDIEPLLMNTGQNSSSSDDSAGSDQGTNGEDNYHYMEGIAPLH
jgi:hypothetical protein